MIGQIFFDRRRDIFFLGGEILLLTLLMVWKGKMLPDSSESEDVPKKITAGKGFAGQEDYMAKTYHIPYAIISEERKINLLNRRMEEYKKSCIIGAVTLVIGGYFWVESYILIGKLFGLILLITSARAMLRYLFNLGYDWTEEVMRNHHRESIVMQIKMCEDTIEELKEQAKEQEAKELARRREEEAERHKAAEQVESSGRDTEAVYDKMSRNDEISRQDRMVEEDQALVCDGSSDQDGLTENDKAIGQEQGGTTEPDRLSMQSNMPELDKIEERFTL